VEPDWHRKYGQDWYNKLRGIFFCQSYRSSLTLRLIS
jgi:hypothetical protein